MSTTDPYMLFEAGRLACLRSWKSPQLIDISSVQDQGPTGSPLIIIALADEVNAKSARTIAALLGAGREAVIVAQASLPEDVAEWLPSDSIVLVRRPTREGSANPEPRPVGLYCELHEQSPRWSDDPEVVRQARYFWDAFRENSPYSLQMGSQAASFHDWFATVPDEGSPGAAPMRFIPTAVAAGPCVVVEAAIGRTPVQVLDADWRVDFSNAVLAYAEMPDGHGRFGKKTMNPLTFSDLRAPSNSVWKDVPAANRLERILTLGPTNDSDQRAVVLLTYVVPVTTDFSATRDCLIRCVDSLVRVRRMLQDPAAELEGRRNPAVAMELVKLLNSIDLVPE